MADKQSPMSRRWLYIPFAIAGAILFAYYLLWRAGAAEMKNGVEAWVLDQRATGIEVSHGDISRDGFPFFLRVHIDDVSIAKPGSWSWRVERLTMDALPYDLNRLIFSTRSAQTIWMKGYGEWRITADDFRTSIANDKDREWAFAATVGNLHALRQTDGASASLASLVFDLAPDAVDKSTLTLNLAVTNARGSTGDRSMDLDSLQTILAVTQTEAFATNDPASAWRMANGRTNIQALLAKIGDSSVAISGGLSLDQNGYPAGRLDAETIAPAALARALGDAGVLAPSDAEATAATLTLAAIAGGGKITAPVEFKNGVVQIAGAKLADLPRLD